MSIYQLREARNKLLDQLTPGNTYPVNDLPVNAWHNKVAHGNKARIIISYAQPGVCYTLNNIDDSGKWTAAMHAEEPEKPITAALKKGPCEKQCELELTTPALTTDDLSHSFGIIATNTSTKIECKLTRTVRIEIGLDSSLAVGPKETVIDYMATATITVEKSQPDVQYVLQDENDVELSDRLEGTGEDIDLVSNELPENVDISVKAVNLIDPVDIVTLDNKVSVVVRPNPDITLSLDIDVQRYHKSSIAYNTKTDIRLAETQSSVSYQLRIDDVDDDSWDANTGKNEFVGDAKMGNGGLLELPTDPVEEDTRFNVYASKPGGPGIQVTNTILLRVQPNTKLEIVAEEATVAYGQGTIIQVMGSQPGVKYKLYYKSPKDVMRLVGDPVYHDRKRGINKAKVGVDNAIGEFKDDMVELPTGNIQTDKIYKVKAFRINSNADPYEIESKMENEVAVNISPSLP